MAFLSFSFYFAFWLFFYDVRLHCHFWIVSPMSAGWLVISGCWWWYEMRVHSLCANDEKYVQKNLRANLYWTHDDDHVMWGIRQRRKHSFIQFKTPFKICERKLSLRLRKLLHIHSLIHSLTCTEQNLCASVSWNKCIVHTEQCDNRSVLNDFFDEQKQNRRKKNKTNNNERQQKANNYLWTKNVRKEFKNNRKSQWSVLHSPISNLHKR